MHTRKDVAQLGLKGRQQWRKQTQHPGAIKRNGADAAAAARAGFMAPALAPCLALQPSRRCARSGASATPRRRGRRYSHSTKQRGRPRPQCRRSTRGCQGASPRSVSAGGCGAAGRACTSGSARAHQRHVGRGRRVGTHMKLCGRMAAPVCCALVHSRRKLQTRRMRVRTCLKISSSVMRCVCVHAPSWDAQEAQHSALLAVVATSGVEGGLGSRPSVAAAAEEKLLPVAAAAKLRARQRSSRRTASS